MAKKLGIEYLVKLDPDTGRWNITRDGKPTGGFARDMSTAIGLASHDARQDAANTDLEVIVWSVRAGNKRKKEWPG